MELKDINCKTCGRFLFKQAGTVVIEGIICPKSQCKARMNFKLIQSDPFKDITHKFVTPEQPSKMKAEETNG